MKIKAIVAGLAAGLLAITGCNRDAGVKPGSGAVPEPADHQAALKDANAYAARAYKWLGTDYDKALKDYDRAIKLEPGRAAFWNGRGFAWHMKSIGDRDRPTCEERALADYAEAIRLEPNHASAINNRAWLRATTKADQCRDGKLAVEEATRACELTGWKNPGYLDTLSVAYAEVGDFGQAIHWQRKALEYPSYQMEEGENAKRKLALFGKKLPFRE